MDNMVLPKRRQILLQLEAMLATYDARTEPLSASETMSQVSTEGYLDLARLALEQETEIDSLNQDVERTIAEKVEMEAEIDELSAGISSVWQHFY